MAFNINPDAASIDVEKEARVIRSLWDRTPKIALSRSTALPGAPAAGDVYIVPDGDPTYGNQISFFYDAVWHYLIPTEGWTAYILDTSEFVYYDGVDWQLLAGSGSIGDVVGPPSATSGTVVGFDGTTGKLIQQLTAAEVTVHVSTMTGDGGSGGARGLVPAPATGDAAAGKFLKADGTWAIPTGSGGSGGDTVEISMFASGLLTASELLLRYEFTAPATIPAGLVASQGSSGVAATGTTALTLKKNGTSFGTATWAAAGTEPTLAAVSTTNFIIGDVMTITAPVTPDATIADVSLSIVGTLL